MSTIPPDRPDNPLEPLEPPAPPPAMEEDEASFEADAPEAEAAPPERGRVVYRGSGSDPVFGYLIGVALAIGLLPLIPDNTDLRYVIVWTVLAGFGVLSWLLGSMTRIQQETPENLAWGVIFGLIIATPLLAIGGGTPNTMAKLMFRIAIDGQLRALTPGVALALLLFVQPMAESLFFRGVLQENRPFWLVGVLSSIWSFVLFFPVLGVFDLPGVAFAIGTALVMTNLTYSYVRQRNGLAAAWLCQIIVNVVLLFLPYISA